MKTKEEKFLAWNKFGLVLRTFATKPGLVQSRVDQVLETVKKALSIKVVGKPLYSRIDIVVWTAEEYLDHDCGETYSAIRTALKANFSKADLGNVFVSEEKTGDLFCGLLNTAIINQLKVGVAYTTIVSTEAMSYFDDSTLASMVEQLANAQVKVVGIAINELTESILRGRIANTFATWDNQSLMGCGGFDLRASKMRTPHDAIVQKAVGRNPDGSEIEYPLAGVEEMIPLCRLVQRFGPCIKAILPSGEGVQLYQTPDPILDPEGYKRHVSKMRTKEIRQDALMFNAGFASDQVENGIIK